VVNELYLDVLVVHNGDVTDGCITTEVVTGVREALGESRPHLMDVCKANKGNLIIGVIIVGANPSLDVLLLSPLQCIVVVLIFHTISIKAIGGYCNGIPKPLPLL